MVIFLGFQTVIYW